MITIHMAKKHRQFDGIFFIVPYASDDQHRVSGPVDVIFPDGEIIHCKLESYFNHGVFDLKNISLSAIGDSLDLALDIDFRVQPHWEHRVEMIKENMSSQGKFFHMLTLSRMRITYGKLDE